ncbi:MAG: FadR family transcriptional regulator, partial [Rhodobacteraceae bacterium]|nr:FadR family transcriptional regulator [Paracoccaceae bacterium]
MESSKILFEPIDHDSVVDAVVSQIESMIVSGVLKEGRKLPSEREMAELMDVSRPKLREALK